MASSQLLGALRTIGKTNHLSKLGWPNLYYSRAFSVSSSQSKYLTYRVEDGVAVITFDTPNSKVNTLSFENSEEFKQILEKFKNDNTAKAGVLISGKPDCFIAGADINMLQACKTTEDVEKVSTESKDMLMDVEKSSKPIVAAIMGQCLGGGLEVAMSCHYRIAVKDKKTTLALPEVMLGILPGAGGTQRLQKLVSLPNALDMMLTGKNIRPDKAKKMGLVNQTIEPLGPGVDEPKVNTRNYLEQVAIQTAKGLANGSIKVAPRKKSMVDKVTERLVSYDFGRNYVLKQARDKIMKLTFGNYPAPLKILEVIDESLKHGYDQGYKAETKKFGELGTTKESNALMGLFHGQTHCKKNRFGTPPPLKKIGVLGAGLMGAGIAQVTMDKGYSTILKDVSEAGVARGLNQIESNFNQKVKRKRMTSFERDQLLGQLDTSLDYSSFKDADMVIEAVFEDLGIKHKVIKEVEAVVPERCVFATNTSALPIEQIAKGSSRPEKVIGMHYFSPVDKMQLLEIITHKGTSKETTSAAVELGLKQGKTVITVGDGPGFYTTRILSFMMAELLRLFQEGVRPKQVDKLSKKFGWPVGAATLVDEVGIDVASHIGRFMKDEFGDRYTDADVSFMDDMVDGGNLGRKSGKGVYLYQKGSKDKPENPAAIEIMEKTKIEPKMELTDENIQWRLASRFINEAVLCLQEGILASPIDGDVGAVFGLGFPPFFGGPFRYLDNHGAKQLVERMERFQAVYGDAFKPCDLLYDHAKDSSKRFRSD
ncbi:DgyrCDS10440 [Dimorphilus gyrociliatus]|uniref:Trifunctional enzyme subunit alpha, mitochondrial n=1 Tax=Dimorphilus gyrociliatus TaxID=2664684 RepID=A0A7I8W1E3_9ANNE|nr:DgyrCDS10440 [Dimorphilus gyrociliatus]